MASDYYGILGLPQNATNRQVRARFLELTRMKHPDLVRGGDKAAAEEEFQAITQAFNVLSDPNRRRQIDAELARPVGAGAHDDGQATRVYLQRGVKAYRLKNYLEAADNFERATKEDPNSGLAWRYLALACRHRRSWFSRATTAIAKACELEPMNASYLKLAGDLYAEANLASRAERYYRQALNWGGEDAQIDEALLELKKAGKKGGLFGR